MVSTRKCYFLEQLILILFTRDHAKYNPSSNFDFQFQKRVRCEIYYIVNKNMKSFKMNFNEESLISLHQLING